MTRNISPPANIFKVTVECMFGDEVGHSCHSFLSTVSLLIDWLFNDAA
jgi:hypothetical protein